MKQVTLHGRPIKDGDRIEYRRNKGGEKWKECVVEGTDDPKEATHPILAVGWFFTDMGTSYRNIYKIRWPRTKRKSKRITDKMRIDAVQKYKLQIIHDEFFCVKNSKGEELSQGFDVRKAVDAAIKKARVK